MRHNGTNDQKEDSEVFDNNKGSENLFHTHTHDARVYNNSWKCIDTNMEAFLRLFLLLFYILC